MKLARQGGRQPGVLLQAGQDQLGCHFNSLGEDDGAKGELLAQALVPDDGDQHAPDLGEGIGQRRRVVVGELQDLFVWQRGLVHGSSGVKFYSGGNIVAD